MAYISTRLIMTGLKNEIDLVIKDYSEFIGYNQH